VTTPGCSAHSYLPKGRQFVVSTGWQFVVSRGWATVSVSLEPRRRSRASPSRPHPLAVLDPPHPRASAPLHHHHVSCFLPFRRPSAAVGLSLLLLLLFFLLLLLLLFLFLFLLLLMLMLLMLLGRRQNS
jgi:hypothetical protein